MLRGPAGIAVNNKGVIAVADNEGHCIHRRPKLQL